MIRRHKPTCYRVCKRALDLLGAAAGLVVLGILFLPVAIAIKLDSPGPIFFVQARVGKDERVFPFYKFRTMRIGSPVLGKLPSDHDARVTAVGRFLRRTGIDEVPQFINVLRGEMSLVGPRPELPDFFPHYAPWQRRRVEVLPGITGWWQVNGRRQPMQENISYDIYYVDHCSLALDLKILLLTIPALFRPEAEFPSREGSPAAAPAVEPAKLTSIRSDNP